LLIAGNWKSNCDLVMGKNLASSIVKSIKGQTLNCQIAIFPPFTCLNSVSNILKNSRISLGAQDCSEYNGGAYTGEVSAGMLLDVGCKYVIVGHSERRIKHGETSKQIRIKTLNVFNSNLKPIVCVGETEKDRDLGKENDIVKKQITSSIPIDASAKSLSNLIIAYEPVWAIGSGLTPTINEIERMFKEIKKNLKLHLKEKYVDDIKILYGGSVNKKNSNEILSLKEVDGALIGGASLNAAEFSSICLEIYNKE